MLKKLCNALTNICLGIPIDKSKNKSNEHVRTEQGSCEESKKKHLKNLREYEMKLQGNPSTCTIFKLIKFNK